MQTKQSMLPLLTLCFGLIAGYSYMQNVAIERIAIMDEDALQLAKQAYRRGCVDQGGKFKECEKAQGFKDFAEIFKNVEQALSAEKSVINVIPQKNNQVLIEIKNFEEFQKKSIKI